MSEQEEREFMRLVEQYLPSINRHLDVILGCLLVIIVLLFAITLKLLRG